MTVAAPERAGAEQVALQHAAEQGAIRAVALAVAARTFLGMPPGVPVLDWWFAEGRDPVFTAVAMAQEMVAMQATPYVRDVLAAQGYDADVAEVRPETFAAVASDNRPLDTLLDQAAFRVWTAEAEGLSRPEAAARGDAVLRRVVHTQVTDTAREADQVALVGADIVDLAPAPAPRRLLDLEGNVIADLPSAGEEPPRQAAERRLAERKRANRSPIGWVRLLTPPSCGRCAILAGKWYGWNDGFQRHPNCDCRHIPCPEVVGKEMTTDPREYFDSLSREEQNFYFGADAAQAIRDGADMSQVVNARRRDRRGGGGVYTVDGREYTLEGTTRRGYFGRTEPGRKGALRPTPTQIYRDAGSDREEARRLLREFGYIGQ